ncbi:50S ribosomal protein L13 [Patescibacteria group bacterium]|nr:50S ribosomal protein L13 [Patescibacteria group bacterium]
METHTLDASNTSLGKLAVQVSILLRGKQKPDFVPYKDHGDFVLVKNFKQVKITGNKLEQKKYYHHSGYIGGLKEKSLGKLLEERPAEVLRKAVWGMLPKNKLRVEQIKRLKVEN